MAEIKMILYRNCPEKIDPYNMYIPYCKVETVSWLRRVFHNYWFKLQGRLQDNEIRQKVLIDIDPETNRFRDMSSVHHCGHQLKIPSGSHFQHELRDLLDNMPP